MYASVSIASWNFYWHFTVRNRLKLKWIFTGKFTGFTG